MENLQEQYNNIEERINKVQSHINYLQTPYKYFKYLNILPVDLFEAEIEPRFELDILLFNDLLNNYNILPTYYLIDNLYREFLEILHWNNSFKKLINSYAETHNIYNSDLIDKKQFINYFINGGGSMFYKLEYINNFDEIYFDLITNLYLKYKQGVIHRENRLFELKNEIEKFDDNEKYKIPLDKIPEKSKIIFYHPINKCKQCEFYVIKTCKQIVKVVKDGVRRNFKKTEINDLLNNNVVYKVYRSCNINHNYSVYDIEGTYYMDGNRLCLEDMYIRNGNSF